MKTKTCINCKHKIKDDERRFITDEYGTFFDEICPECKEYV